MEVRHKLDQKWKLDEKQGHDLDTSNHRDYFQNIPTAIFQIIDQDHMDHSKITTSRNLLITIEIYDSLFLIYPMHRTSQATTM